MTTQPRIAAVAHAHHDGKPMAAIHISNIRALIPYDDAEHLAKELQQLCEEHCVTK